ncbi:hypothetical protein CKA32_006484 [Geitlerinema sp. FC II]|nr:hypothetical protein CKA32_006484 [Geitlerinema sp. FC II]
MIDRRYRVWAFPISCRSGAGTTDLAIDLTELIELQRK